MPSFLEQLAEELIHQHKGDFSGLSVVFPTRRAGLFFKRCLAEKIDKPQWSPQIYSIQDFIRGLTPLVVPDQLALLFELFEVYKNYFPSESFDTYFPWGEMLLKDFDEADRSLADTKQLFAYIKAERQIDTDFELPEEEMVRIRLFWKAFFNKDPGKLRNEFLENWKHLGNIYAEFRKRLIKKNWAYEGLAYRLVTENLEKNAALASDRKIIFAGFYALSKSEEEIIQYLLKEKKAEIYWDADSYYFDDPKQEAGTFLRNSKLLTHDFKWKQDNFASINKRIEAIGVPLQVGQAKLTGNILNELVQANAGIENATAIVLPDENLLFSVLYSLPENIEAFNVTMGYPLVATPVYTLIESLMLLQKNIKKRSDGTVYYYHKHVLNILHHPSIQQAEGEYIRSWLKENQDVIRSIRVPSDKLCQADAPELLKDIFQRLKNQDDIFSYLKKILLQLLDSMKRMNFRFAEMDSEYIYHFYVQLKRLEDLFIEFPQQLSVENFWSLYREIIYSSRIPFSGEPLKGLQVMGFLETRLLDFENVFILSVNEDMLPSSSNHPSFVPFSIRKAFGLPTYEDQQAIASYHFYRLLQRSKNIYLLYNTESKSITAGEKSRYLLQIEHELKNKFPDRINWLSNSAATDFVKLTPKPIVIQKSKEVVEKLNNYFLKDMRYNDFTTKFSASSLISYMACPLKFYFQYIVKIRETEEAEDHIEAATFGKILHRTMQFMYMDNRNLTDSVFEKFHGKIREFVDVAIKEEFTGQDEVEGKNILMRHVIVELVKKILNVDKKDAPISIRFLEERFFQPFKLSENHSVLLYGIIDRVDEVAGSVRIIDYKTGKVDSGNPSNMEEMFLDPKFKEQFQTFFYAYLFWKQSGERPVKAGVMALKNMSEGIRYLNKGELITAEQFMDFESNLFELITEIFDESKPFVQTEDAKRCEYCTYREICSR